MDSVRIARIIELEGKDRTASATRWETAKLYWEEAHSGTPQKDIAERVGKSRPYVCHMVKTWERFGNLANRPSFNEAYHSPEVRGPSAERGPSGAKGRPTQYRGILMRSRLEADYAQYLDSLDGVEWEYEPEDGMFAGPTGQWLADFWVKGPSGEWWVELKPDSLDAAGIAAQMSRISAIWYSVPDAAARLVVWRFRQGAILMVTGHDGLWEISA